MESLFIRLFNLSKTQSRKIKKKDVPSFFKNTLKNLYFTKEESLIFDVICFYRDSMGKLKVFGTNKDTLEQVVMNTHSKIVKTPSYI